MFIHCTCSGCVLSENFARREQVLSSGIAVCIAFSISDCFKRANVSLAVGRAGRVLAIIANIGPKAFHVAFELQHIDAVRELDVCTVDRCRRTR